MQKAAQFKDKVNKSKQQNENVKKDKLIFFFNSMEEVPKIFKQAQGLHSIR